MKTTDVDRRDFLKTSGAGALAAGTIAGLADAAPARTQARDKNSKLRIGFIGPGGRGFGAHVKRLAKLAKEGQPIELAGVCDVFTEHVDRAADYIKQENGNDPQRFVDYREMLEKGDLDAVSIGTPDHWHAKQSIDALNAGLHVYCEKPMTKTVEEAIDVMRVWKKSGRVMQVGVQSTSLPVWDSVNEQLRAGKLGKVLMYQTEFFRNSAMGQWRYYQLRESMSPKTINWKLWLGVEEGLSEELPFDRAVYAQWRRFWPFGSGMFTDLFVHRTTAMLKATGLRFPGRVVGGGGIYLEYDGRDVPDVSTVVADFPEGVQGVVTATMACQNTPIRQLIRGHFGSFVFGTGERFGSYEYVPERPQVTRNSKLKPETIEVPQIKDTSYAHFKNWIEAMLADDPQACNNPADLGAAAVTTVILGARSHREGKVFHFDDKKLRVGDGDASWANQWEQRSHERGKPNHIAGWQAGDYGSVLEEPPYMKLAGPWTNGADPAGS
ncbi:MAG: Gfo/Idh/MocA family oxidoreductase [Pirellulaceae bacterium]|jgi:predicted dehydrogenase|nr:Gfo/Idh/MocA family oxidoreductase [Pirellulaceae bacterium]MDP7015759.1 Gfo/Idh/MocA family oxidoreductase [Pirellulaceae bacterium]